MKLAQIITLERELNRVEGRLGGLLERDTHHALTHATYVMAEARHFAVTLADAATLPPERAASLRREAIARLACSLAPDEASAYDPR